MAIGISVICLLGIGLWLKM